MSVKFKILIGLVVAFVYTEAEAQMLGQLAAERFLFRVTNNKRPPGQATEEIVGSPYLVDDFISGAVSIDKGTYAGIPLRYNIYDDRIEFKQNDVVYVLEPDARIKRIVFGSYTFVAEKFEYKWKMQNGYLVLLDSGKISLMSKKVVTFKERQEPRAMESAHTPAKYSNLADIFYLKIGRGEPKKFDNMKELIAMLPDKQEEVTQFVKQEKISPKKEEELIMLMKYYNSL